MHLLNNYGHVSYVQDQEAQSNFTWIYIFGNECNILGKLILKPGYHPLSLCYNSAVGHDLQVEKLCPDIIWYP